MLSGEAMQRGRYAGFGDGSFDDPPTFQLDSDASPRFAFSSHESYEDSLQDGISHWPSGASQNSATSSTPSPAPIPRSNSLQSYEQYNLAPLRGNSMLDMDSVDTGIILGEETEQLGSPWPHSDFEPQSARSNDDMKPFLDRSRTTTTMEAIEEQSGSNQVSPSSLYSNETATTETQPQSVSSTTTSPMETTSHMIQPHLIPKNQRGSSKSKSTSHASASSENRGSGVNSKKRQRNTESNHEEMAEKDEHFLHSVPPPKRQNTSKKATNSSGTSTKGSYGRIPKHSEEIVSQESKTKKSPLSSSVSETAQSVSQNIPSHHSPNDLSTITQTGTTTVRIRATTGHQSVQKQPSTPVVTTPNSAAAFKMPSSLPSSYLKAVTSPQTQTTLSSTTPDASKNDTSSSNNSPSTPHSGNGQGTNIYSLMGTSPPDISQTAAAQTSQTTLPFALRPLTQNNQNSHQQIEHQHQHQQQPQQSHHHQQLPLSQMPSHHHNNNQQQQQQQQQQFHQSQVPIGSSFQYGQSLPVLGLSRSAPNIPNGQGLSHHPLIYPSNSNQNFNSNLNTNTSTNHQNQNSRHLGTPHPPPQAGMPQSYGSRTSHDSSPEEQWSNLENLMALSRIVGEMNEMVTYSVQDVQHQSSPSAAPTGNATNNPTFLPNHMPNQMGSNNHPSSFAGQVPNPYHHAPSSSSPLLMANSYAQPNHNGQYQDGYMNRLPLPLPAQSLPSNTHGSYPGHSYGHTPSSYGPLTGGGGYNIPLGSATPIKHGTNSGIPTSTTHHFHQKSLPNTPSSPWGNQSSMGQNGGQTK